MIRTKVEISGIEYIDFRNVRVTSATSENNASSDFEAIMDSPYGRHSNDFTVGNED